MTLTETTFANSTKKKVIHSALSERSRVTVSHGQYLVRTIFATGTRSLPVKQLNYTVISLESGVNTLIGMEKSLGSTSFS